MATDTVPAAPGTDTGAGAAPSAPAGGTPAAAPGAGAGAKPARTGIPGVKGEPPAPKEGEVDTTPESIIFKDGELPPRLANSVKNLADLIKKADNAELMVGNQGNEIGRLKAELEAIRVGKPPVAAQPAAPVQPKPAEEQQKELDENDPIYKQHNEELRQEFAENPLRTISQLRDLIVSDMRNLLQSDPAIKIVMDDVTDRTMRLDSAALKNEFPADKPGVVPFAQVEAEVYKMARELKLTGPDGLRKAYFIASGEAQAKATQGAVDAALTETAKINIAKEIQTPDGGIAASDGNAKPEDVIKERIMKSSRPKLAI